MKATQKRHAFGQRLWIDSITRSMLSGGRLRRFIEAWSVTGLIFNPTVFAHAILNSSAYDAAIRKKLKEDLLGEALLFELALEDIGNAADLFRPIYEQTDGVDGWVSLEVSPLLAHDTAGIVAAAKNLYARAGRPNLFIKIPGTKEGLPAVEEAILAGVPVNVTLLFSREHYLAAADAFIRGIERRIANGLKPDVSSVASLCVSPCDAVVMGGMPEAICGRLGIAIARHAYNACRELLSSPRWARVRDAGARPQRLVWATSGNKDPRIAKAIYIETLAAPFAVITMSEAALKALADRGDLGAVMPAASGDCEAVLGEFGRIGVDIDALATRLQQEAAASLVKSWIDLMEGIASKSAFLTSII